MPVLDEIRSNLVASFACPKCSAVMVRSTVQHDRRDFTVYACPTDDCEHKGILYLPPRITMRRFR